MSVIGLDIGNENCVVALAKQRGIDVVLNEESRRETPGMVCFGDKQRFLGTTASSSATLNPKTTISQIKRLIGRKFRDPEIQHDLRLFPFQVSEASDGSVLVNVKKGMYSPSQILGMLLSHLKNIAARSLENQVVSDCVIGIPAYFTDLQRRAYLDAAAIAKLNPLRLMHESAAIALAYGIYKTDLPATDPLHVVFVDVGHSDTQVSVVAFINGHFKVLSHAFDQSLGGRNFDEVLFRHFARKFKEDYGVDVFSNPRACIRMRTACEKLKKVLSANTEAPLSIECLMDENDLRGFIKRDEFEKLSSDLLERLKIPCKKALEDADLSADRIHSVEVVGSGSRIPAILKVLKEEFRREPSRTLNASECIARGCALQCAMLSPTFRVREFQVEDTFPFSIRVSVKGLALMPDKGTDETQQSVIEFLKGTSLPISKLLECRGGVLSLDATYMESNGLSFREVNKIGTFTIAPPQGSNLNKVKIKIRIGINLHGLLTVEAFGILEDDVEVSARTAEASETENNTNAANISEQFGSTNDSWNCHYVSCSTIDNSAEAESSKLDFLKKGRRQKIDLHVNHHIPGVLSCDELQKAVKHESDLAYQDKIMEETKDKKNAVESYVYDMRNKLIDKYQEYAKEFEREDLSLKLQQTEDWLYAEGGDQTKGAYVERLKELKKIGDPIEQRFKEEEMRKKRTHELERCIEYFRNLVQVDVKYDHIGHKEKEMVIEKCNGVANWLKEKLQQQNALSKSDDPVLVSSEINVTGRELERFCRSILAKPKPKSSQKNADGKHNPPNGSDRSPEPMDGDDSDGVDKLHID